MMEPNLDVANNVDQIIDKLADKLGVAVDALQPMAETIVAEVSLRGWVTAAICLCIAIISPVLAFVITGKIKKFFDGDKEQCEAVTICALITGAVSLIAVVISLVKGVEALCTAIAPHLYLIEKMLK